MCHCTAGTRRQQRLQTVFVRAHDITSIQKDTAVVATPSSCDDCARSR